MKSKHPKPNWLGLTPWKKLYDKMTFSCCDCGLAHDFLFRIIPDKKGIGVIKWRCKKNKQITKENRAK